jgi:hypothetical protein
MIGLGNYDANGNLLTFNSGSSYDAQGTHSYGLPNSLRLRC